MMSSNDLWSICHDYYFKIRLSIQSEQTRNQYRYAINNLSTVLNRTVTTSDLTDDNLAILSHWLTSKGTAAVTTNERVGRLKTLWTWLARRGIVSTFPTLERIPEPETTPRAWTVDELRRLFDACAAEPGTICGIPAGLWWVALHSWLWCTAERKSATFALEWPMIDLDGMMAVLPASIRKGGRKPAVYQLWPECCAMLRTIREPARALVFPWELHQVSYYLHYSRILKRAGLPSGRRNKTHAMRVSHATWREVAGGDASRALGHSDPATTRKYYLDERIAKRDATPLLWPQPSPPPLPRAG